LNPVNPKAGQAGPPGSDATSKIPWRPLIAAGLSLVFAGLGHLYLRQYGRGIIILIVAYFLLTLSDYSPRSWLLNIVLFIFSAFDAFSFGKRGHGIV
jgi:hypothetical protein